VTLASPVALNDFLDQRRKSGELSISLETGGRRMPAEKKEQRDLNEVIELARLWCAGALKRG
jgi:hypothetical protein